MNVNGTGDKVNVLIVRTEPITDEILGYLSLVFKLILNSALAAMGICGNAINMAVFLKMGLSDGVTQNFFILSISDFLGTVISFTNSVAYILRYMVFSGRGGSPELNSQMVHWGTILAVTFPQNFSLITTVVIAVVRCCCVAMPLRVKYLITAPRQLAAILFFSSGATIVLSYVFAPIKVIFVHNPFTNSSMALFVDLRWYTFTLFTNIFFYSGFIIVIICVIILTVSLYRSSKFREKSTIGTSGSDSESRAKEGRRETRIVKTVVFVSIVFIVCYLPTLIFSIFGELVKEFSAVGFYRNANAFFLLILDTSLLVNANVNIFIYFFFNARYRNVFTVMFRTKSDSK